MEDHHWIVSVCKEISAYAELHGLPETASAIMKATAIAQIETSFTKAAITAEAIGMNDFHQGQSDPSNEVSSYTNVVPLRRCNRGLGNKPNG